jgi:hypothetical protein
MTYPPGPPEPPGAGGPPERPGQSQPPPPPGLNPQPLPPATESFPGAAAGPRPMNVLAIVSLVLSLISFCVLPIVGAIAAIITGHVAKRQIRETGEEGAGIATAGVVVGWIHLGLVVLIAGVALALALLGAAILDRSPAPFDSHTPSQPSPSFEIPAPSPS